jgi:hypothetical protein
MPRIGLDTVRGNGQFGSTQRRAVGCARRRCRRHGRGGQSRTKQMSQLFVLVPSSSSSIHLWCRFHPSTKTMVPRRRNPVVPRRTVRVGGCPVQTTVTPRPAVVRRWLHTTLWLNRRRLHTFAAAASGGLTVGLGVQWRTPFRKLPRRRRAAAGHAAAVRRQPVPGVPARARRRILRRFLLADARATFAGYYVASHCRKLRGTTGWRSRRRWSCAAPAAARAGRPWPTWRRSCWGSVVTGWRRSR